MSPAIPNAIAPSAPLSATNHRGCWPNRHFSLPRLAENIRLVAHRQPLLGQAPSAT